MRSVGAELFHADGWTDRRTDMTKLTVAFHNFGNAPKKAVVALARTGSSFYFGPARETAIISPANQPSFCNSY